MRANIKFDNVMIYKDLEALKPILIDFGKACKVGDKTTKRLTDADKRNLERDVLILLLKFF